MKKNQFSEMSAAELNEKVVELKKELFNLRFQLATGQLQDTMAIANTKTTAPTITPTVAPVLHNKECNIVLSFGEIPLNLLTLLYYANGKMSIPIIKKRTSS